MSQLIFYSFLVSSEILICIKIQLNISGNETQALKEYLKWLRARRPPAREKT